MAVALATLWLSGTSMAGEEGRDQAGSDDCVHPYPCGDEWPEGHQGPYQLKGGQAVHVRVPMDDGVELNGWIGLPDVIDQGVKVPVALNLTPYLGDCPHVPILGTTECDPTPTHPRWWSENDPHPWAVSAWGTSPFSLVSEGYAVAFFTPRGTGASGGCWDYGGPRSQRDAYLLVEWLAGRKLGGNPPEDLSTAEWMPSPAADWSNGRVGMGGISAPAHEAFSAAVMNPPGLKAVVLGGLVTDPYLLVHSVQGATHLQGVWFDPLWAASQSLVPPAGGFLDDPGHAEDWAPSAPARVCDATPSILAESAVGAAVDDRDGLFWTERNLMLKAPQISAAALVSHSFHDGSRRQEDELWRHMTSAPKRFIKGQFGRPLSGTGTGHRWPSRAGDLNPDWDVAWDETVMAWLDYWLKGLGEPARVGSVDYQVSDGTWRESKAWPAHQGREEVLYLGDSLSTRPGGTPNSFLAAPAPGNHTYSDAREAAFPYQPFASLCPDPLSDATGTAGAAFFTSVLEEDVVIAGNPFAYLNLTSDQPGGLVGVQLVRVGPSAGCTELGEPAHEPDQPADAEIISEGVADLRFHAGTFQGEDFESGHVRIDLQPVAERLRTGDRLALVIARPDAVAWLGQPFTPNITIETYGDTLGSHVVLPIVEGTIHGKKPKLEYPARPFLPN